MLDGLIFTRLGGSMTTVARRPPPCSCNSVKLLLQRSLMLSRFNFSSASNLSDWNSGAFYSLDTFLWMPSRIRLPTLTKVAVGSPQARMSRSSSSL